MSENRKVTLQKNNNASKVSEAIVYDKLNKELQPNEQILVKPRIYIGDGSSGKYATPDFAIWDVNTGKIVRIVDAKDGQGGLTKAQEQVQEFGGVFRGSSRAPDMKKNQTIKPQSIEIETTNVQIVNQ